MIPKSYFKKFRDLVLALPANAAGVKFEKDVLIRSDFRMFSDSGLDVYYAPFHHFNSNARVVLVGLTPGWTQMEEAFRAARQGIAMGLTDTELFGYIDRSGSFSGPLRANLVSMLDGIGLARSLRIGSCNDLFGTANNAVTFTSVVSAPIFHGGENYRGSSPHLLNVARLIEWIRANLAEELASAPNAVVIPLGKCADNVMDFLQRENLGQLKDRCLQGFPHPSGANGHRRLHFLRSREKWIAQLAAWLPASPEV